MKTIQVEICIQQGFHDEQGSKFMFEISQVTKLCLRKLCVRY